MISNECRRQTADLVGLAIPSPQLRRRRFKDMIRSDTFVIWQSKPVTFEANVLYLLFATQTATLFDIGTRQVVRLHEVVQAIIVHRLGTR
jgi:hypothetical protein